MIFKNIKGGGHLYRLAAVVAAGLWCGLSLLWGLRDWPGPAELQIAMGMTLFFIAPGFFLGLLILGNRRICLWERLPLSIALSMGVWALPGLIAYVIEMSLGELVVVELYIAGILFAAALVAVLVRAGKGMESTDERPSLSTGIVVFAVGILAIVLSAWMGAFRGAELDWDYFNYISHVRKLVFWDKASIAHFAYKNAPPDPVHSYNIWALQWALVSRMFEIDPIALYSRSSFITIPATLMAFYGLCRRLLNENVARAGLLLYFLYQLAYGGFLFIGRTTFYPADSQWLLIFPACLYLFTYLFEESSRLERAGIIAGLALSVLAMSIVHVLWGLCFYIVLGLFAAVRLADESRAGQRLSACWRSGKKYALAGLLVLAVLPYLLTLAKVVAMVLRDTRHGRLPLFTGAMEALFSLPPAIYFLLVIVLPLAGALYLLWRTKTEESPTVSAGPMPARRILLAVAICLIVSIPYIFLRYEAVQATNWGQFGRNPYRAFISDSLFVLNPFKWSLQNPNMTFYPLYMLAYLALPLLWWKRKDFRSAAVALAVLIAVPLVCFHPVVAPLFTGLFSLGYLRRLLRLAALFSFLPLALLVSLTAGAFFKQEKRPYLHILAVLVIAVFLSGASVFFKATPSPYNNMLEKRIEITLKTDKDSLVFDDTPFRAVRSHDWFSAGDIIFSDIWTSYRLTAYLPLYIAVQAKPGTGVADQDTRRLLAREFFDTRTSAKRMRAILSRLSATGVIVNSNPYYTMPGYGLVCGHPEAAGKMRRDKEHFVLLFEKDDWLIFLYKEDGLPGASAGARQTRGTTNNAGGIYKRREDLLPGPWQGLSFDTVPRAGFGPYHVGLAGRGFQGAVQGRFMGL